jgi:branched-chain amino acid transport system permease protein
MKPIWKFVCCAAALALALWGLGLSEVLNGYIMRIASLALINIILAASLNLINGMTGQFSLGHMGFAAIGAYVAGTFTTVLTRLSPHAPLDYALFLGATIVGGLAAAFVGILIGFPSLRLRGDYLAIVTLGFGEIIKTALNNIDAVGGPRGLTGIPAMSGVRGSGAMGFLITFAAATLTILAIRNLAGSTHGRALLSIRENELAAELCGVDTTRFKVTAFAIGAFFAGIAGSLLAHLNSIAHPTQYGFMGSVMVLIMVYVGGMGSITGSIIAAFGLTVLSEVLKAFIALLGDDFGLPIGQEWVMVLYALMLVLVMLFRNEGIMGNREMKWLRHEEEGL